MTNKLPGDLNGLGFWFRITGFGEVWVKIHFAISFGTLGP